MNWPSLICLIGTDGTGKTTHARILVEEIRSDNKKCTYRWLHYARLLSLPLLAYARLQGLSKYKMVTGQKYGSWEFKGSFLLCHVLPWLMLVDAFLFNLIKVRLPLLLGYTVVVDRYIHDILVDIMLGTEQPYLHRQAVGRLFLKMVPRNSFAVLLEADAEKLRMRRGDLKHDKNLEPRRKYYNRLAQDAGIPIVRSEATRDEVHAEIVDAILAPRGDA